MYPTAGATGPSFMPLPGMQSFPWATIPQVQVLPAGIHQIGLNPLTPLVPIVGPPKPRENLLPVQGNEKANMEDRLYQNISDSNFYKGLHECKTVEEVVEKASTAVKYINAWGDQPAIQRRGSHFIVAAASGSAHLSGMRGWVDIHHQASPAWCIIAKWHQMKLSHDEMESILSHDSPYVRCLGLIYLRLVCPPKDLWEWFEEHLKDDTELTMTDKPNVRQTTVKDTAIGLLTELKYLDTRFPRIAETHMRTIRQNLSKRGIDAGASDVGQATKHDKSSSSATPHTPTSPYTGSRRDGAGDKEASGAFSSSSANAEKRRNTYRADLNDDDLEKIKREKERRERELERTRQRDSSRDRDRDRRGGDERRDRDRHWDRRGDSRDRDRDWRDDRNRDRDRDRNRYGRDDSRREDRSRDHDRERDRRRESSGDRDHDRKHRARSPSASNSDERESKKPRTSNVDIALSKLKAVYGNINDDGGEQRTDGTSKVSKKQNTLAAVKMTLGGKAWGGQ